MKLASIKPKDIALVKNDSLIPMGETLARESALPKGCSMLDVIVNYANVNDLLESYAARITATKLNPKMLKAPIEKPSKIWAAAANYKRGTGGLDDARGRGAAGTATAEQLLERIFLKPPSCICGPEDNIIIPNGADTIFPELELCVVIGKETRNISKERAYEAIFGYTILLDVTARGYGSGKDLSGSRCVRKGFETFAPIGPWITTKEEIADPHQLSMKLWINGELKQSARTDSMVNDIPTLVSYLSQVTTLFPGDLISTGNPDAPEFQEKLKPGDILTSEIEGIGAMNLGVAKQEPTARTPTSLDRAPV
jgi:2-keto-4-pentenoate hydratase/2-oxohepta-3-ene-1,7-dioic acid hydratase in catechol pathway